MKSKYILKFIAVNLLIALLTACTVEESIKVNPEFELTYERNGGVNALAGQAFYVIPKGSGEFLTLFDGTTGRVWGETGAKGIDFNKADSLAVSYSTAGTYKLTIVSTSSSNFGNEITRLFKTVDVTVVDERNSFTNFFINDVAGVINPNNEIVFSVPDITTNFNFKAIFNTSSPLAKVFVNDVEQISGTTINDFTNPVTYKVKSAQSTEKEYKVIFNKYAASSEKQITKFTLGTGTGGNGEVGVIDELNKTISIIANYGTNVSSVNLYIESSYGSRIIINSNQYILANATRSRYNLTTTASTIKVIAQNNSEIVYTLIITNQDPVSSFTFLGLIPSPVGIIDNVAKTITIDVLKGTDITKLIAKWVGSNGTVKIGTMNQTNGTTANDFSSPKSYVFYKGTTVGATYTVTVQEK